MAIWSHNRKYILSRDYFHTKVTLTLRAAQSRGKAPLLCSMFYEDSPKRNRKNRMSYPRPTKGFVSRQPVFILCISETCLHCPTGILGRSAFIMHEELSTLFSRNTKKYYCDAAFGYFLHLLCSQVVVSTGSMWHWGLNLRRPFFVFFWGGVGYNK